MGHFVEDRVVGGLHLEIHGFHYVVPPDEDKADPELHHECDEGECENTDPFDAFWVFRVTGDNKLDEIHRDALKTQPTPEELAGLVDAWKRRR